MSAPQIAPSTLSFAGYGHQPSFSGVSFWPRVLARAIDLVFHFLLRLVAAFGLGIVIGVVGAMSGANIDALFARLEAGSVLGFILALAGGVAYHAICEGLHGSTLGKRIMGQVVLTAEQKPCGPRAGLIRSLAYIFPDAWFLGAVAYFEMQKSDLQQRYGDRWAGTFVCKRADAPPEALRSEGRFLLVLALAVAVDLALQTLGLAVRLF